MAVLVGVLAPQFIKYVEQSRRSRDIQTAQEIREAVLADIADGKITADGSKTTFASPNLSTVSEEPTVSGNVSGATGFTAVYTAASGTCYVMCGTYTLTTESGASAYKAA